jgi:2-haloacid dehalogenase
MARETRLRWLTFDCFGTLVDWQAAFASALAPIAGGRVEDVVRSYHAHERVVEQERPHRAYKDVVARTLRLAAAEHGIRLPWPDQDTVDRVWSALRLFDDVEAMLAELRLRGYRLAVLTNCDDDLFAITHRTFRRPFDLVLTAERVRGYKPAAWHFRGFEQVTRVTRNDWVHVASSWYHDIEPARALGIKNIWLDRERAGSPGSGASARVHSAAEIAAVLPAVFDSQARGQFALAPASPSVC